MDLTVDIAIVGSGFGGSLLAMIARRLGLSVLLAERGRHPRFAIGESTSPLANLILEQIGERYDLAELKPLTTYGAWRKSYPELVCGLKRGFSYYKLRPGKAFQSEQARRTELLVAASPNDTVADTHWLRADIDAFLVGRAEHHGAEYWDETEARLETIGAGGGELTLTRKGRSRRAAFRLLVDASGPRGFLHNALALEESRFTNLAPTQALFTHFEGVGRTDGMPEYAHAAQPPFPPDDAALHHVFDDGWMWVLRFGSGVTSAGVSLTERGAESLRLQEGACAWDRLLSRYPSIAEQFAAAQPVRPFLFSGRPSYRAGAAAGPGWAMLPSAAAFVDPLFSTGIPLTLIGIERIARVLETGLNGENSGALLQSYSELTLSDADWTAEFVAGCFAAMPRFELFSAFSMYYFAAASFSEMARRLGSRGLPRRFLLQDAHSFADGLRRDARLLKSLSTAPGEGENRRFADSVADSIRPFNIAGLADADKHSWYGIAWSDVIDNARCLGMEPDQMRRILAAADWAQ